MFLFEARVDDDDGVPPVRISHHHAGAPDSIHLSVDQRLHGLDVLEAREIAVGCVLREVGARMHYTYNLGDAWECELEVEDVLDMGEDMNVEELVVGSIEGWGACPAEGCKGALDYVEQLEAVQSGDTVSRTNGLGWSFVDVCGLFGYLLFFVDPCRSRVAMCQDGLWGLFNKIYQVRSFAPAEFPCEEVKKEVRVQLRTRLDVFDCGKPKWFSFDMEPRLGPELPTQVEEINEVCAVCGSASNLKSCAGCKVSGT